MSTGYAISDFRRDLRNGPYAWPGGYPRYFILYDGEALSFDAAKANRRLILEALRDGDAAWSGGWRIVGADINWEDDTLYCADSGKRIPSAYGEA